MDLRRRWIPTVLLTTLVASARGPATAQPRTPPSSGRAPTTAPGWQRYGTGALVRVELETSLYQLASSTGGQGKFFVHVRLVNLARRPVGVDLSSRARTVYPNQWSRGDDAARSEIDERRALVPPLAPPDATTLRGAHARGQLRTIAVGGAVDYYAEFNGDGRAAVDALPGRYVLVSIAGEVRATDGQRVEQLAFDFSPHAAASADACLRVPAAPLGWSVVPVGATVVHAR
jgi:hypothetical protein